MRTKAYWRKHIAVAFSVMVIGYWLMTAFTFTLPSWLVVLASTLGVLTFVDWVAGRLQSYEPIDWLRPAGLTALTLVGYGVLTSRNFLPSSALLLSVLGSVLLLDLVLNGLLAHTQRAPLAAVASTQRV
jgi:hypothetical protein